MEKRTGKKSVLTEVRVPRDPQDDDIAAEKALQSIRDLRRQQSRPREQDTQQTKQGTDVPEKEKAEENPQLELDL